MLRLCLHPDGLAPRILTLGSWRAHLLARLRHQIAATGDPRLQELLDELRAYPAPPADAAPLHAAPVVPIRLRAVDGSELAFLSTTTLFGTPGDVTVDELAIEAFLPADDATAAALGAARPALRPAASNGVRSRRARRRGARGGSPRGTAPPDRLVRLAAGAALHATATGVGSRRRHRLARRLARDRRCSPRPPAPCATPRRTVASSVASTAVDTAAVVARAGARAAGAVITGVDDATDGNLDRLAEAGKAMFEPPAGPAQPPGVGLPRARPPRARDLRGRGRPGGAPGAAPAAGAPRRRRVGGGERRRRPGAGHLRRAPGPGRGRRRGHRGDRAGARRHAGLPAQPGPPGRPRAAGRGAGDRRRRHRRRSASPTPAACCRCRG